MCFSSGGSADKMAKQARADEVARQNRIKSGMSHIDQIFSAFSTPFYDKRASDYNAYAMPEVDRQGDQQRKQLVYALARTGNLDSSAAIEKSTELSEEVNKQRIGVTNEGINQANQLRSNVEQTRGNLVSELNATGNDQATSQSAMRELQRLNQPAGFSPLGNLFLAFADGVRSIGSRAGNGYSGFAGGGGGGGAGLFQSGGSMRVVGG